MPAQAARTERTYHVLGGPTSATSLERTVLNHPTLVARDSHPFLSWFSAAEGYRLIPID